MFSCSPSVVARLDVTAVEVSGDGVGVDIVVKINLGSSIVLLVVLEFLLRAFTMIPPSTFSVTVFNGVVVVEVVVVIVVVVIVVVVIVVVVVVVEVVIVVNFVIDFFVVVTETVGPEVDESFLLRGLTGGVMRIEGRPLGFSELFPS